MQSINDWLAAAAAFVWGPPLIVLLFGTHLYLTWRTGFVQRHLLHAIRLSVTRDPGAPGDVSQFGALTTALAGTIGTGNIYGVAGAVLIGGPGAVLWMWLTGVFGIATKYGEALLAVHYRSINAQGEMSGGPMYVLERGLQARWAGVLFCLLLAVAAFGIGNLVQANALADMVVARSDLLPFAADEQAIRVVVGVLLAAMTAAVILGGIRSITRVCTALVPLMALVYVAGCLAILASQWRTLDDTLWLIVSSAFSGQAAVGGFLGAGFAEALRAGVARGLFSNESGLGTAPIVAAAAQTHDPVRQALVSGTGTFWDTVVVCALTGMVLVGSGDWTAEGSNKAALCNSAFAHIGLFGDLILTIGLLTFVFSTILGYAYYGEKAIEYLLGLRFITAYRWLWVLAVFVGCIWRSEAVWNLADAMNGLLAIPNLIALLLLSGVIARETQRYFATVGVTHGGVAASLRKPAA
jgi:alanine or glycine:cation symporter, AGCS family